MAEEAAASSEIKPEQVQAAMTDRTRLIRGLDAQIARCPGETRQQLRDLANTRMLKDEISAELSDLGRILDGVTRGDLSVMEEIPPSRLDDLLGVRTERVARYRGVPIGRRMDFEAARRAFLFVLSGKGGSMVMAASPGQPNNAATAAAEVGAGDAATSLAALELGSASTRSPHM